MVAKNAKVEAEPEVLEPEPQTEPSTPDIEALLAKAKEEGKAEAEETYKGFQRTVTRTQDENRKLRDQLQQPKQSTGNLDVLESMVEEMKQYGDSPRIADITRQIAEEKRRLSMEAQQEQFKWQQSLYEQEEDKARERIEASGEDPDDAKYYSVFRLLDRAYERDGKFERAHERLDKLLGNQEKKKPEDDERRIAEKARELLEKRGDLEGIDLGHPSGKTGNDEAIGEAYAKNPDSPNVRKAYLEMRQRRGY